jgi:hypothetical protein
MSGPIVRRYGFPNFDKIFGERPLQHGAEESDSSESRPDEAGKSESKPTAAAPPKDAGEPRKP